MESIPEGVMAQLGACLDAESRKNAQCAARCFGAIHDGVTHHVMDVRDMWHLQHALKSMPCLKTLELRFRSFYYDYSPVPTLSIHKNIAVTLDFDACSTLFVRDVLLALLTCNIADIHVTMDNDYSCSHCNSMVAALPLEEKPMLHLTLIDSPLSMAYLLCDKKVVGMLSTLTIRLGNPTPLFSNVDLRHVDPARTHVTLDLRSMYRVSGIWGADRIATLELESNETRVVHTLLALLCGDSALSGVKKLILREPRIACVYDPVLNSMTTLLKACGTPAQRPELVLGAATDADTFGFVERILPLIGYRRVKFEASTYQDWLCATAVKRVCRVPIDVMVTSEDPDMLLPEEDAPLERIYAEMDVCLQWSWMFLSVC